MNLKLIIAIVASVLTIVGFIPYLKDIFAKKTKPHLYTWLIWGITQVTATVALLYGGGKFGSISLIIGVILVLSTLLLSFKYGTKNITKSDKAILALALLAIVVWWRLESPLLALFMVSAIDGIGYIPTIRKSFVDPWSETISFWSMMALVDLLTIISNDQYNLLTTTYITTIFLANIIIVLVCFFRRQIIQKRK